MRDIEVLQEEGVPPGEKRAEKYTPMSLRCVLPVAYLCSIKKSFLTPYEWVKSGTPCNTESVFKLLSLKFRGTSISYEVDRLPSNSFVSE
jgi:hypothetical protein